MATNFYFQSGNNIGTTNEQRLVEDLIIESLKIYGHDTYYLPRTLVNKDTIFDEDELSKFTQAYPVEMYLDNVNGYEGQGDIFTRFGLEVRGFCLIHSLMYPFEILNLLKQTFHPHAAQTC